METNILIINLGYNDLLYKINLDNNLTNNKLTLIIKEIETNYNDLIKEIRKYNKNKIIVIGYYSPNNDNYYLNKGVIKLNKLLKNNKEVEYIETYNLLSNREIYFSNPNSNYPNRYGYKEISNSLSKVNYKK
jgi:lysophospholipase L1-like esterase